MDDVRVAYLAAARSAVELLGTSEVAAHWDDASALAELTVGGLAGHLLRGTVAVETYLDQPEPDDEPISAAAYYYRLALPADLDAPANRAIRERSYAAASFGAVGVVAQATQSLARLSERLEIEDADRRVRVASELALSLNEYLRTRIVELLVHTDDLAASVGLDVVPDPRAGAIAIETLLGISLMRYGNAGVLRAFARRERDAVEALRVF